MGVHGLWRLIEPSGKPVALETLENKVLAVDVSIWLHQAVKGFQDSKGAPVPNAHLLGIYHRVCKLLYFKIKPVFIFDGGVPVLKKQTIAKRNQQKSRNVSEAERLQRQLLSTLLKHSAISKVLSEKTKASLTVPPKKTSKHDNMYALPTPELDSTISSSSEEDMESATDTPDSSPTKHWDLHTIDMASTHFKSLPVDVRHEILTELKETRKQNSWGRLHELPKQSDDFALYQMKRLLKRQAVQTALEDAEKEMGGHSLSLAELESILNDHGVATTNNIGKRIASDENTRYLYIKDVKQALEKARKEQEKLEAIQEDDNDAQIGTQSKSKADLEYEEDLEKAIALSLQEKPSTSKSEEVSSSNDKDKHLQFSFLENFNDADFESDASEEVEEVPIKKKISSAQSYMMEYSGLTPNEINKILNDKKGSVSKSTKDKKILEKGSEYIAEIISDSKDNNQTRTNKTDLGMVSSSDQKQLGIEGKESCNSLENIITERNANNISTNGVEIDDKSEVTTAIAESTKQDDDIMSISDSSGEDEFEEVSVVVTNDKDSIEIMIDPNQKPVDDLFSDIFNDSKEEKKIDTSNIVIQPKHDTELVNSDSERAKNEEDNKKVTFVSVEKLESKESSSEAKPYEQVSLTDVSKISTQNEAVSKVLTDSENEINSTNKEENRDGIEEVTNDHKDSSKVVEDTDNIRMKNKASASEEITEPQKSIPLNLEEMRQLKNDLQKEKIDILVEKSVKERMASNITDQMYQEAQDLLELFGVPYIVAPMEAEAQCAFLDAIELTDGTITDDSDIWLFGGRTVYKNFFNQSKYVMEFKVENIKHHFKLTREQMILLALLVGSDYTIGLLGVGPVTALEILAAFPPSESKEFSLSHAELLSGLKEFRSWFNKGKSAGPGRSSLKNKLKNITFTENFPSLQVVQAYLEPTVETSRAKFSWSKPDFVGLTDFAREKFGWTPKKTEEILKPVIKKVEETQAQKSIKDYFKTVHKAGSTDAQNQMSKRVKSAIDRIGKTPEELIAEEMEALSKEKQKRSRSKKSSESRNKERKEKGAEDKPKRSRKKKSEDTSSTSNKTSNRTATKNNDDGDKDEDIKEPVQKKPRNRRINKKESETVVVVAPAESSGQSKQINEDTEDVKTYENIALELRKRRQRRNELSKIEETIPKKKAKPPPKKTLPSELIPQVLEEDEEIQLLQATTSRSLRRVEEINREVQKELDQEVKKQRLPNIPKREVIHQKLRDKSDTLKNKLRAIEIFRKSKKGPGYMSKRGRKKVLPKEDAELSENSSDD